MKRIFDFLISLVLVVVLIPIWLILLFVIEILSPGPFVFTQMRMGKGGRSFKIYKIRTMVKGADRKQNSLLKLNEVESPVFKIENDPRFIKIGKFLSSIGIDESLQLINVLKGEMSLVGPRPLPIKEAKKLPLKYQRRLSVLPGITSLWVVRGAHRMGFKEWMNLDLEYVKKNTVLVDSYILFATFKIILRKILSYVGKIKSNIFTFKN